jgi:hypothetical protein
MKLLCAWLYRLLVIVIAVGLGLFIAWLGTTPTIDAPRKAFDRLNTGTAEQKSGTAEQGDVKQGAVNRRWPLP